MKKQQSTALAVAALLWLEPSAARAQDQLRKDLIESARDQKQANLTPETSPAMERRIEQVENSLPFRLVTGEVGGFGLSLGAIMPGVGFGIGPRFTRGGLLGGRLTVGVDTRFAVNESYIGQLTLSLDHLLADRAFLDFSTTHRNISEMPYYGPGPDSEKTGRSDYRMEDTNVELRPGVRIYKKLRAAAIGSYYAVNVGPGHASRYISSEQQYSPAAAPGIDQQTNFWRGGGMVEYDWRDRGISSTSGGRYAAQYVRYLDRDLGAYSFFRLDLDASQYIPLVNRTHVIALRAAASLTDTSGAQRVPFYLQPTLGGPDTLRGYRYYRFYGDNSTIINGEYRWLCAPWLEFAAFVDAGKVFNHWEQWNFHSLESDVGFGVRLRARESVVFRLDTGFSHEGFQIWFRMNSSL
jgi:outer membrane protein assembly factor BamA